MMDVSTKSAASLHGKVPANWYYHSIKVNALQRYWHRRRFEEVRKKIEPVRGTILDIGCADGVFTRVILDKSRAKKIIGIDVLKTSVDWATKHWKRNKKMSFRSGNAHKLAFKNSSFDAVFALEVLEHVSDPQKVFKEVKRVLKRGGYFVALVPSDNLLFRAIWFAWKKYGRGGLWRDTHIQSFNSKNTLPKNLDKVGFRIEIDHKFLLGMLHLVKARKI